MNAFTCYSRWFAPLIAVSALGCVGYLGNDPPEETIRVSGTVSLVQVADLTPAEIAALPEAIRPQMERGGWAVTSRGLERSKPLTPPFLRENGATSFVLLINGAPIQWSDDGRYVADIPLRDDAPLDVTIEFDGELRTANFIKTEAIGVSGGDTNINVLWYKLREPRHQHAHATPTHGEPAQHSAPDVAGSAQALTLPPEFTCNDYNGPNGDCTLYPDSHPQRYVNFVGSDCEEAWFRFGLCWLDFNETESRKYCTTKRNCSALIGHEYQHHCH